MKFVKKPDVIEAMKFDGTNAVDLKAWVKSKDPSANVQLAITTVVSNLQVPIGSWVIADGLRFGTVEPGLFWDTYDVIEEE